MLYSGAYPCAKRVTAEPTMSAALSVAPQRVCVCAHLIQVAWESCYFFKQKTAYEIYQCDWSQTCALPICAGDYYRIVSDDRLMWGGRISMRGSTPWRLQAALPSDILKGSPQLEGVESQYAWAGVTAYAAHKMPQIGELAQGYWLAGAFGGHGLNTTAMAGEIIARAILEGDDRWRLFSPYELVWAGGRWGRATAQTLLWSMQMRDSLKEKLARYRDRARREADARQMRFEAE